MQGIRTGRGKASRWRRLGVERLEDRSLLAADLAGLFSGDEWEAADAFSSGGAAVENVQVTDDSGVQQMPSVAVNPLDADHVVIAYMDYSLVDTGYAGIGMAVSRDGGATWQPSSVPVPEPFDQGAANPVVQFDDEGRVYVAFMAVTFVNDLAPLTSPNFSDRGPGFQAHNGIFVARSDDGGDRWNEPVAIASHLYDGENDVPFYEVKPDLAIDTFATLPDGSPNPHYGNLYVVWTRLYGPGQFPGEPESSGGGDIMLAVSQDGGKNWLLRQDERDGVLFSAISYPLNFGTGAPLGLTAVDQPHIAIGPLGDLYLSSYWGNNFAVHHSTDAGLTFAAPEFDFETFTGTRLVFGNDFSAVLGEGGMPNHSFRTGSMRAIAADPTRPGRAYVLEPLPVRDALGDIADPADVFFAISDDFGLTWQTTFVVGSAATSVLNDDNDGLAPGRGGDDVIASQALPRLATDSRGNLGVIWYDARRDPDDRLLDVFGTFSRDGGATFSPNFRITTEAFDADRGAFTSALGGEEFYLGDAIGLALAGEWAYAAWTDVRSGNQDIFFARLPIAPAPPPPNDRFEGNDSPATATPLGPSVQRLLPRLSLPAGDEDWFAVQAVASGELIVTALAAGERLQLELWDEAGAVRLAAGRDVLDDEGQVIGVRVTRVTAAAERFLVRVLPFEQAVTRYSLEVQSLTADLGTRVHGVVRGAVESGDEAYYLLRAAAAGTLAASLSAGSDVALEILDRHDLSMLAAGPTASVTVQSGQAVLIRVTGTGSFEFSFRNLDQFTTQDVQRLLIPVGGGPSAIAAGDLNGDGRPDLVVANALSNTVSILLGNGDGTFQAPRQFAVGAFAAPNPVINGAGLFGRRVVIGDFNSDTIPDLAVTNFDSSDVSILLGRGDGTFQSQRRFDATAAPFALDAGDVNGDGILDLVVADSPLGVSITTVAVLLGRGDGSFLPQRTFEVPSGLAHPLTGVKLADLNGDGLLDLILSGDNAPGINIFLGTGDGRFELVSRFDALREAPEVAVADLNGDGHLDLVLASSHETGEISVLFGNGDGTFQPPLDLFAGQAIVGVTVVDFGATGDDGSFSIGRPDGQLDIVLVASGVTQAVQSVGGPEIVVLPGLRDEEGNFAGFGPPQQLAPGVRPLAVVAEDLNADGVMDLAVVDRDGVQLIFGAPPQLARNASHAQARDLSVVVHHLEPTQTIVPGRAEAWFRLRAPVEAHPAAGDQVLDFSGGFAHLEGAGLAMQVLDAAGNVLGEGPRLRLRVAQGEELFVRIFGVEDKDGQTGYGAFTLNIVVLPQVVAVEAVWPVPGVGGLPGGPVSSIVITFQGERLDLRSAQDPGHYRVVWLGPDGVAGTADDREISLERTRIERPVIYNASSNIEVSSGQTFPTAVRQTVTLVFPDPLPAGAYQIVLAPQIQAQAFNESELDLLSEAEDFHSHPVVSLVEGAIRAGAELHIDDLIPPTVELGDLDIFEEGTPFLTQLHNDLSALLDAQLSATGDNPAITPEILDQIVARLSASLGPEEERIISLLVVFLDPVTFFLVDPDNRAVSYNLQTNAVASNIPRAFIEVGGNVELVVVANPQGTYELTVADVPARARGGVIYFGNNAPQVSPITDALLAGTRRFVFETGGAIPPLDRERSLGVSPSNPGLVPNLQLQLPGVLEPLLAALGNQVINAPLRAETLPQSPPPQPSQQPSNPGGGSGEHPAPPSSRWPWPLPDLLDLLNEVLEDFGPRLGKWLESLEEPDSENVQEQLWRALFGTLNGVSNGDPATAAPPQRAGDHRQEIQAAQPVQEAAAPPPPQEEESPPAPPPPSQVGEASGSREPSHVPAA